AHLLAGRVLAVLAEHGLEVRARRGQVSFEVAVDADPLHVATDPHLLLAHHRDVVLRIAADHAGVAAGAGAHVDRHAPGVFRIRPVGEHRRTHVGRLVPLALVGEAWVLLVFVERGVTDDAPRAQRFVGLERVVLVAAMLAERLRTVILVVALGDGDAPLAVHLPDRPRRVERRPGGTDEIGVEARPRTHPARGFATVTQIHRHRVVGMAGRHDHRSFYFSAAYRDLHDVVFFELELGEGGSRHDGRVVPAQ